MKVINFASKRDNKLPSFCYFKQKSRYNPAKRNLGIDLICSLSGVHRFGLVFLLHKKTYQSYLCGIKLKYYYLGAPINSRCQTAPSLWTLGSDQPVIPRVAFIR